MIEVQEPSQCICIRGGFYQRNYLLRNSRNVTSAKHRSRPEPALKKLLQWTSSYNLLQTGVFPKFPEYEDFRIPCSDMWKRIPHTLWQYSPHIQQVKFSLSSVERSLHLCLVNNLLHLKHLWHWSHLKGLSPLWILTCVFKCDDWLKHSLHWLHL